MVSNPNASAFSPLKAELKTRMKIAIFMVLLWQFTRVVIFPASQNAALLYSLYALLEISSMVVIFRFSGNSNVGKDINEFNLYALIVHIVGIPVYYLTEIPLAVHDNSIWGLFILAICRLFYFSEAPNGEYKGIPSLSLLLRMQKKAASFNHWSELLFFGSAIPLWYIIYQTSDRSIAITSVGLMIFIYLITDVMKTQKDSLITTAADKSQMTNKTIQAVDVAAEVNAKEGELSANTKILVEIFNARSKEAQDLILKFAAMEFNVSDHDDFFEAKKATAEAMRLIEQFRDEKHRGLSYQEILVGATFNKLPVEKQRFILFDAQIIRTLEHEKIRQEIAEQDAKRERREKFMKWKFYSGKLAPKQSNSGKESD